MNAPTRPVLRWHGGKWKLAPWIISHFPKHRVYVEPFGGAASVLLQKPAAITEVWNDLEAEAVNLFRVLRSSSADLARLLALTPFSRAEYHTLYETTDDPVERARRFVARSFMGQSSKGALRKSGFDSRVNPDGYASRLACLRALPGEFAAVTERLAAVIIESKPANAIFNQYDADGVLFYVDPPYLSDRANHYTHELDQAGHIDLLAKLHSLSGMVALSGYSSELYDSTLSEWRRFETKALADTAKQRTEVLWLNPACAHALDRERCDLFARAAE
jgi:DNA adenine methylase